MSCSQRKKVNRSRLSSQNTRPPERGSHRTRPRVTGLIRFALDAWKHVFTGSTRERSQDGEILRHCRRPVKDSSIDLSGSGLSEPRDGQVEIALVVGRVGCQCREESVVLPIVVRQGPAERAGWLECSLPPCGYDSEDRRDGGHVHSSHAQAPSPCSISQHKRGLPPLSVNQRRGGQIPSPPSQTGPPTTVGKWADVGARS